MSSSTAAQQPCACAMPGMPTAEVGAEVGLAVLMIGRSVMGFAEGVILTSGLTWGMMRVEPHRAGQAMAWNGLAFFLAIAIGAPVGTVLQGTGGFGLVCLASIAVPL